MKVALVEKGVQVLRPQFQGPAIGGGGLAQTACFLIRPTQLGVAGGLSGLQGDDALPARQGGGAVLVGDMRVGQVAPNLGIVGRQLDGPTEVAGGLPMLAFEIEGQSAIGVDLDQVGRQPQGPIIGGVRLGPAFQDSASVAQVIVRGGQVRLQTDRFLAVSQGFLSPILIDEHLAEVAMGQCQIGIEPKGGAKGVDGVLVGAQLAQGGAQVVLSQGEVAAHSQGGPELLHGLGVMTQGVQGQPQVVGRFGKLGLQTQSSPAAIDCLLMLALSAKRLRQVGVEGSSVWAQGHRPAD